MRIGVDATCWSNRRGYGRFTRDVLNATLALDRDNHYLFFVDEAEPEFAYPQGVELRHIPAKVPTIRAAAAEGSRSLRDLWTASRVMSRAPLDIFFFPSVYSYVPLTCRVPKIVAVHDVIADLYPDMLFPSRRSKFLWNLKMKMGCAQAAVVVTVSEYSRRRLAELRGIPEDRLRVVSEASDPAFHPVKPPPWTEHLAGLGLSPSSRFVLYVGGISPHKNLRMLVDAFREAQSRAGLGDTRLVLAGDYQGDVFHSCYRELVDYLRATNFSERVVFTGYVDDRDLLGLLNAAQVLALPSFCEGFGLPAVEAAACGTPVVVTTESPLPEVLGAGAIAVSPEDRAGWSEALARLLGDEALRVQMGADALAAASQLSWQNSARQLLAIFDEVRERFGAAA
jgi:glycosyltransferase involved in cell wall biosynthesis